MWTCPRCERPVKNPNQWHNCVKVDIDSLFEGKSDELPYLFDRLFAQVVDWEAVAVSATKNCVVFVAKQTFLVVRPMKTQLDIKFYSADELTHSFIHKSAPFAKKWENHVRLAHLDELTTDVIRCIRQSYRLDRGLAD